MATKRGLCPFCTNKNLTNRLFVVNPDAAVVYCPNCMKEMTPSQAIKTYADAIEVMVKKADNTLLMDCDPNQAYQDYANILEIDNTNAKAYLGRLLCLVYMSKVRNSYIEEAGILLDEEIDTYFHRASEISNLLIFLKRVNRVVDEYEINIKKKLTFRNYFFDKDCLSLYLKHIKEIIVFKQEALNECRYLQKKYSNVDTEMLISLLESSLIDKNKILEDEKFITTDGKTYRYESADEKNNVTLKQIKTTLINTRTSRYRMSTLDINNKKLRYIPDDVFKDYAKIIKNGRISLAFSFTFFLFTALATILAVYFYNNAFIIFVLLAVLVALFLFFAFINLGLFISSKSQIKKRRQELNQ